MGAGDEQLGLSRVPPGVGASLAPLSARLRPSVEWGIGRSPSPGPSSLCCESRGTPALHLPLPASSPGCSRPVGLQRGRGVCDREAEAVVTMAAGAQGSRQRMRLCPCLPQRGFQGSAATRGGEVKGQLSRQQQPPPSPSSSCSAWGGATGGGVEPRPGGRGGAANQLASQLQDRKSGPPTGPWLRQVLRDIARLAGTWRGVGVVAGPRPSGSFDSGAGARGGGR